MKNVLSVLLFISVYAQTQELTVAEIMKGEAFVGTLPSSVNWHADHQSILFKWTDAETFSYGLSKGEINSVSKDVIPTHPDGLAKTRNTFFFINDGNLYQYNRAQNKSTALYKTTDQLRELQHVLDSNSCYYRLNQNLYSYNRETGSINQVTYFKKKKKPKKEAASFQEEQNVSLFEYLNKTENQNEKENPFEIYLNDQSLDFISITPTQKQIIYRTSKSVQYKNTNYFDYNPKDGNAKAEIARAKVGQQKSEYKLWLFLPEYDSIQELNFSFLSGIRKRPNYQKENYGITSELSKDKTLIFHKPIYSNDGQKAILSIKSQDNKDRWIVLLDCESGALTELTHQHDEAWIGGPGIHSWNSARGTLGWLNNDSAIYFQSEETGYSHLYLYHLAKEKKEALTKGNFEIQECKLSNDGKTFYIQANKTHPGDLNFYHLDWKKKKLTPIITKSGNATVTVSPDEKHLAIRFSTKNEPWELYLSENKSDAEWTQITQSTTETFQSYEWQSPEVVNLKARDGKSVYARLYQPEEAVKNNAAVIFVHGAGYLQNAHNWWSNYFREYMFHNLLTDLGYTVLDIDYRASKGYGRDHRTAIYRHMGGKDLNDQIDGLNWLVENQGIDAKRVGIYGGSYGGFITLMGLLTAPNTFACGGALRSVTDWAHYNHGYTSNILNTPEEDSIAYKRSSPIYFAEGLADPLIMFHGVKDDNVHFQDVVRLSQRFIELGKTDWELVPYPIERHGFSNASSWTHEYTKLLQLFNTHLLEVDEK